MKTAKVKKILSVAMALLCGLTLSAATVFADTVVAEPEVKLPATIEIQLGPKWASVEFQLKTDEGLYPESIPVGADGVLRLGLNGSDKYILSCMNSAMPIPSPEEAQVPATTDPGEASTMKNKVPENQVKGSSVGRQEEKDGLVSGIPLQHIILFGGGLLLAIGGLITMHILKKRRTGDSQHDNDEEDE